MIRISAEHIYVLCNSTGRPFTDLLDRLIRTSAAIVGIPPTAVSDNPRTNIPDGGVDTEVSAAASSSDPWNYFATASAWQYKAVEVTSLTDAMLTAEIEGGSKTYVRDLIQRGYGYRMCIADHGSPERKHEMEAVLNIAIKNINRSAPDCIVLFANDIVAWTNAFPPIAAELTGSELTGFFHFQAWAANARSSTPTYVPTPESALIQENVRKHLDWSNSPTVPKLTISGDAGVGKTRTVFEAISEMAEVRSLVLYTDDEDEAIELARGIANQSGLYAVIVADECMDTAAFLISRALQGCEERTRLITIDNTLERTDKSELRLAQVSLATLEKILEANFPQIEQTRRYRYCHLAQGFLRFAVSLCANDNLIVQQGHIGESLHDTKSYLGTMFGNDRPFETADQTALDLISLVERCGVIGNVSKELEDLCSLTGLDPSDVRTRLHRMQKKTGLVGRAGRYFYVTPTPIAMVCFQSAWSRWAEIDTRTFLDKFPRNLTASFLLRVSRSSKEVGQVVTAYFRNWVLSRGGDIFSNQVDTEQLLLLVRANPEQMMHRLHSLVLSASANQLAAGYHTGRRALVTEVAEIAAFPQWFPLAEEMLFGLALHETERDIGNNATELWKGLFPIINSTVATPFPDRLNILRRRKTDEDPTVRGLCVSALQEATEERSIHMVSSSTFGRRVPPAHWLPKTWDEYFSYLQESLSLLRELSLDKDTAVRTRATTAFIQSIRNAMFHGILEPTKKGAGEIPKHVRPILRSELREFLLLSTSQFGTDTDTEKGRKAPFIETWIAELASSDLHDQLVEEVGPDTWSHYIEQAAWERRVNNLAERLIHEHGALSSELPWLNSRDAGSSFDLGVKIGRLDERLSHLEMIVRSCRESRAINFARGYFTGASDAVSNQTPHEASFVRSKLNTALDAIWQDDPILGFSVMLPSGDFLSSFERSIAGVKAKQIPAALLQSLAAWNGPRHTTALEARRAAETLLESAKSGDEYAATTGLDFIQFLLMRDQQVDAMGFLATLFEDASLETVFGLLELTATQSKQFSHWFSKLFVTALSANPARATKLVVEMMKSDRYEVGKAASELISVAGAFEPRLLMEAIGEAMTDRQGKVSFLVRKFPISTLPAEVIIEWIRENGVEGARVLARHVPGPFIGANGPELHPVTKFLMDTFGEDKGVFASFVAGIHTGGVFVGSIADWAERGAALAEQFLDYPNESIRKWARGEVAFSSESADHFREREEEEHF
jgi:hypothetical protein